jgi:uncharacterized protein YndB with AHSA1/START domain
MHVQAEVVIRTTPQRVWAYITRPENGPEWQEAAVWTRVRSPGPIGLGTEMDHEGRFLGMRLPTTGSVTVFEPTSRFGYELHSRFGSTTMLYELADAGKSTRLRLSADAPFPLVMRPLAPILARNVQRMFDRDIVRLRDRVEAATQVA